MPASAAKSWSRLGHQAPLPQRWDEQSAELARVAPGNPALTMMISEVAFDQRAAIIQRAKLAKAQTVLPADSNSRYRNALVDELIEMRKQLHPVVVRNREIQERKLPLWAKDPVLREAGLITADLFAPQPTVDDFVFDIWTPTSELTALRDYWRPRLDAARQTDSDLGAVATFLNLDPADRAMTLVRLLIVKALPALADRCERAEAAISALQAKRSPPRKKSKRPSRSQPPTQKDRAA